MGYIDHRPTGLREIVVDEKLKEILNYWESEAELRKARGENYITVPWADNAAICRVTMPDVNFSRQDETWNLNDFLSMIKAARARVAAIVVANLLNEKP